MAEIAAYELHVDLNNDRDFGDANEDFSSAWRKMEWQIGATDPYSDIARTNTFSVLLNNPDGRYSPEHASAVAGFRPGALIRVRSVYAATTRQHFIGWIDPNGIRPDPFSNGSRTTQVTASGYFSRLLDSPVRVALQEGKRADEVIEAILSRTILYPPGFIGWLLGVPSFSELGQHTFLGTGVSDYANLETGISTFNYVGDNWNDRTSVFNALREVIASERGFLYENREGKVVFYNRHHWHQDMTTVVDATITDDSIDRRGGMDYRYGNVLNRRSIQFRPRKIGTSTEVIGRANTEIQVSTNGTSTVRIAFDDGSGNRIGGKDVITPIANTDWTANTESDGSGTNLTSLCSVIMTADGNSAELIFSNTSAHTAIIRNLQIRGTKLTDFGQLTEQFEDADSINQYGLHAETLNVPLLDDPSVARDLARWDVMLRKDPTGEAHSVSVLANRSAALMGYALARTIGDRVDLSESHTGHEREVHIVGEQHIVHNRYHHAVTHFLRPVPAATAWILGQAGYSELGQTTYLAA